MRKTIMFLLLLCFIQYVINDELNCLDVMDEEGFTNCSLYEGGIAGFSCYNSIMNNDLFKSESCTIFPTDETLQKQYVKYLRGYILEERSISYQFPEYFEDEDIDYINNIMIVPEKETYKQGETIILKNYDLTDSDKKVINSKNNCYYHFYGKLFELIKNEGKSVNISSLNILDKNICFNADNFDDNENLVKCGFGQLNITSNGKSFNITTCFFVPDQISNDLLFLYSNSYKNLLDTFVDGFAELNDEGVINLQNKVRKLVGDVEYEFIVEDDNGKKVKYSYDNSMVQIINDDGEYVSPITPDGFGCYFAKINIFMALSLLSLLL